MKLLNRLHSFGVYPAGHSTATYQDENTIIYISGCNLVVHDLDKNTQKLIPLQRDRKAENMAISPCRKMVAAVEARVIRDAADPAAPAVRTLEICIYNLLMNNRVLCLPLKDVSKVSALTFIENGRKLAMVIDDSILRLYKWESTYKRVAETISQQLPQQASSGGASTPNGQTRAIQSICSNPHDFSLISICGDGIFKMYQLTGTAIKNYPCSLEQKKKEHFFAQLWLDEERVIVGSAEGSIYVVQNGELQEQLARDSECENSHVHSLTASSKYIACGTAGGVELFDREKQKLSGSFSPLKQKDNLISVNFSPSDEALLATTSSGQVVVFQLDNIEIMKSIALSNKSNFTTLQENHSGPVNDIATCIKKDILLTAGTDRKIEVINFTTRRVISSNIFPEEPFSVSLHPTGLFAVIGFSNRLRVAEIQHNGVRIIQEIAFPMCKTVKYSTGGHFFAAASGSNINVYNSYTLELISCLRGHVSKVTDLFWSQGDDKLLSVGDENIVYCWGYKPETRSFVRSGEVVIKGLVKYAIVYDEKSDLAYVICSDSTIRTISFDKEANEATPVKLSDVPTDLCLCKAARLLFVSFSNGYIQGLKIPSLEEVKGIHGHRGKINKIAISYSERTLLSAGSDSTISIYEIGAEFKKEKPKLLSSTLVTLSDYEDIQTVLSEMQSKVDDLKLQRKYQQRIHDVELVQKEKDLVSQRQQELDKLKKAHESTLDDYKASLKRLQREIEEITCRNELQVKKMEGEHSNRVREGVLKYEELFRKLQEDKAAFEEKISSLEKEKKTQLSEERQLRAKSEDEHLQELQRIQDATKEKLELEEEIQKQIEEDADFEVEKIRAELNKKLNLERSYSLQVKGELSILKMKLNNMQSSNANLEEEVRKYVSEKQEWKDKLTSYAENIRKLEGIVAQKDKAIGDSNDKAAKQRKSMDSLEKSLDSELLKNKGLREDMLKLEAELEKAKTAMKGMEESLTKSIDEGKAKERQIALQKQTINGSYKENQREKQKVVERNMRIQRMQNSIGSLLNEVNDPAKLKKLVLKLSEEVSATSAASRNSQRSAEEKENVAREYEMQRGFLEKTVDTLERKLRVETKKHDAEIKKRIYENMEILNEVKKLREELDLQRNKRSIS